MRTASDPLSTTFQALADPTRRAILARLALGEARQKLARHRPETLGMASRISGITPASISLLLIHLKKSGIRVRDAALAGPAGQAPP